MQLLANSGSLNSPVGTGELAVLVVTDSTQDHGQGLVTSDRVIGTKGLGVIALDVLGIGAVVDVASVPRGALDVVKLVVVGIDVLLGIGHIAGSDAVDDSGDLSTGDGTLGLEAAIIVALEHLQVGQNGDGLIISGVHVGVVREGVGGGHQRHAHDQSQDQRENLLQISHGGCFLLLIF